MSTVKVTATIEIEFEVRQELAQPALARIPHDVAVGIEHGSIGSSMTGVVPGSQTLYSAYRLNEVRLASDDDSHDLESLGVLASILAATEPGKRHAGIDRS
jgi:hypothetical protein